MPDRCKTCGQPITSERSLQQLRWYRKMLQCAVYHAPETLINYRTEDALHVYLKARFCASERSDLWEVSRVLLGDEIVEAKIPFSTAMYKLPHATMTQFVDFATRTIEAEIGTDIESIMAISPQIEKRR